MKYLVALAALAVSALAAPQLATLGVRPAAYQAYQPLAYTAQVAPAKIAYKPVAYTAPAAYKPIAPAYKTYTAPVATVAAYSPVAYTTPAYKPVAYTAPAYKPVAYTAPAYQYAPQPQYTTSSGYIKPIAILRQIHDDNFDGSFTYEYETENGIASSASGYLKNAGSEAEAQVIQGQYSYTAPDGTPIVTRWFADDTGFHAEGDHIPRDANTPPYKAA